MKSCVSVKREDLVWKYNMEKITNEENHSVKGVTIEGSSRL